MEYRRVSTDECALRAEIIRDEIVHAAWHQRDGRWRLEPEYHDIRGQEDVENRIEGLKMLIAGGGAVFGAFDGGRVAGMSALAHTFFGSSLQYLQLRSLHVSAPYRKRGVGRRLTQCCAEQAKAWGAGKLYASSTPSENTQRFYRSLGFVPAEEINAELFADEPEDVHLELDLSNPPPCISLEPLDRHNWFAVSRCAVAKEQEAVFSVSNLYWMAISRYDIGGGHELFAITLSGFPVGMIGYGLDPEDGNYWIEPLMVDGQFQRRGFGRAAMEQMIRHIAGKHNPPCIIIGHRKANAVASALYESLGFKAIREKGEELFRRLDL